MALGATDTSTEHGDVPSVDTDAAMTANEPETVSIPQRRQKPPDSSSRATRRTPNVPNTCGSHADMLSMYSDVQSVAHEMEMKQNVSGHLETA